MRRYPLYLLWLTTQASCESLGGPSTPQESTAGKQPNTDTLKGWTKSEPCQALESSSVCSFFKGSFNDGFGLSVITTEEKLQGLLSLPAFVQQTQKVPWRVAGVPYREEEVPGKGIGLVAIRRIAAGELILSRTPAVLVDDDGFRGLDEGRLTELLVQAINGLPKEHQSEYLKLSTHEEMRTHEEKTYQIFAKNNYRTRIANTTDFHATFVDVSRLNHDCRPNCGYQFDSSALSQKVYAARDIHLGEELTVSYTDPVQTRAIRQAQLQSNWGFTCTCKHCTGTYEDVTQSDARMGQIHDLWKQLDDYSPASPATPMTAEELLGLYETEGLKTRIHEAYYRAAVEHNGVGDSDKAARFAMLSMLRGQMMAGFDRPFVGKMKELAKDPEKHWTWKFRLRDTEKDHDEL